MIGGKKPLEAKMCHLPIYMFLKFRCMALHVFHFQNMFFLPKTTNIRTLKLNIRILCVALLFQRNNHRSAFNNHQKAGVKLS